MYEVPEKMAGPERSGREQMLAQRATPTPAGRDVSPLQREMYGLAECNSRLRQALENLIERLDSAGALRYPTPERAEKCVDPQHEHESMLVEVLAVESNRVLNSAQLVEELTRRLVL